MKALFLFLLLGHAHANVLRDLNVEKIAQSTCGILATAMTERVHNTNKEMKKEYYRTPVFDKDTDFEMMRHLKLLATESATFTAATPDSQRVSTMLTAFDLLRKKKYPYVKRCLGLYRPSAKRCLHRYEKTGKEDADACIRDVVDKDEEAVMVKNYFLRIKK